ncbi:hypothetical protein BDA96_03G312800 [Sorghum bicolor]|uniref:Ubiquitin-like protease family profile domain-containing protein n=2 Tax=Sorghum bicolor TaxID=4558 RepID=A0A921RF85_SORBI|nr:ubiquitin-like-specific protease 1D isoform X2 [Sorghum bicolor]EES01448.2 hypothetical protein SORBI_3003G289700 [Sorghum bicolor]KAG0539318.1 hypothetical protein BDA96_03G312800 [Sorghum bicolor]|eukprot:XP_021310816.1 ubiquitin-like-specific protease 1D isoform X2 [Sorghum bicolor]
MSASSGGIVIDRRQAMPPDSPAVELEVVGSPSPSVAPCPAAAAGADADIDHGGGAAEFEQVSDKKLQERISRCEGMLKQGIPQRTPDGGEKMQACVLRMKKELERRRARQWKDDTVLRQAVQAKCTGGSRGEIYDLKSDDETMDSTGSKFYPNSSFTPATKTCTQVKGAAYKEESSLSHAKCAYPKNGGQISQESLNPQLKTCAHLPKSCTINQQENSTVHKRINATFGSNRRSKLAKNKPLPSLKIKKDVVLLDDDDDTEPARSADVQISNKDESTIHYPSSTDPEAVELSYSDMKCLEPEEYLKSPVINFCLQYLKKSRPRRDLYMFNTYFYSILEEALSTPGDHDSKFSKLRRWWRSVDIFKKAYIILPINELMHWSLIIVCMPTKESDSGPIMLHLDSLGMHSSQKLFDIVQRCIEAEWRHLQKDSSYDIPFSGRIWKHLSRNIYGEKVEVPRQHNDYDCGLFMLYYIDRFILEAPERLTKEGLGMFGRRWFDHKKASALRERIRQLLFDLFDIAPDEDGPSEPELHPGEDK